MQAIGQQPQPAPDGAPIYYKHHRPDQTTVYRLVQQHTATFFEQAEAEAGADLPDLQSGHLADPPATLAEALDALLGHHRARKAEGADLAEAAVVGDRVRDGAGAGT